MKNLHLIIAAIAIAAVAGGVLLAYRGGYGGTSSENQTPVEGNQVNIQNSAFSPSSITVSVGATVTWANNDTLDHTVSSTGASPVSFDSGIVPPGYTYTRTFDTAGTYTYKCNLHPDMTGTVIVQ